MVDINVIPMPNDPTPFTASAQEEQDKTLLVKFYIKPRPDAEASAKHGRPMFKDVEYIDIKIPGSRTCGAARPATHADKARFPEHYRRFKERLDAPSEGMPLAEWPPISRSMVEQLAFLNVKTVEQLANVPDSQTQNMMGMVRLKQMAQQFLKVSEADAPLTMLQKELEERDRTIAAQTHTIQQLSARLDALEAAQSNEQPEVASTAPGHEIGQPEPVETPVVGYRSVLDGQQNAGDEASQPGSLGAEQAEDNSGDEPLSVAPADEPPTPDPSSAASPAPDKPRRGRPPRRHQG